MHDHRAVPVMGRSGFQTGDNQEFASLEKAVGTMRAELFFIDRYPSSIVPGVGIIVP